MSRVMVRYRVTELREVGSYVGSDGGSSPVASMR